MNKKIISIITVSLASVIVSYPTVVFANPIMKTKATSLTKTKDSDNPARIFSKDSFWYRRMPQNAPLDSQSSKKIANILKANQEASNASSIKNILVGVNVEEYTPPTWIASSSDSIASLKWVNCLGLDPKTESKILENIGEVRIPSKAVPADGTDSEMSVYNLDSKKYTDLWRVKKTSVNSFEFCAGGSFENSKNSSGVFSREFGATGSGLAFWGGMVSADEIRRGEINHVVGVSIPPSVVNSSPVGVASRSDGNNKNGFLLGAQEGQYLKLPASLNIDSLNLNRVQKIFAKAAQKYGLIVWDRSALISFRAENIKSIGSNVYWGAGEELFGGNGYGGWDVLQGGWDKKTDSFPWDKLQLVKPGYVPPVS